jgi:hypothetical protein
MVEALKQRFATEITELGMRHRAEQTQRFEAQLRRSGAKTSRPSWSPRLRVARAAQSA